MDPETIRLIHGYNAWATDRVLACCDALTSSQFVQEDETPWGSIRNQFVHQFIVHKRWLSWADGSLSGEDAYALQADPADFPDASTVRAMWEDVQRQNQAFLDRLTPETLQTMLTVEWPGGGFSQSVGDLMLHIAHHSMQHRTEATMALTRLGQSPGDIDYLFYSIEQRQEVSS